MANEIELLEYLHRWLGARAPVGSLANLEPALDLNLSCKSRPSEQALRIAACTKSYHI